jgi:hypothetical protein
MGRDAIMEQKSIDTLIAKDDIRDLALLYCRGCDRRDFDMIRGLYTTDAMEYHDETFTGPAQEYVDFLGDVDKLVGSVFMEHGRTEPQGAHPLRRAIWHEA